MVQIIQIILKDLGREEESEYDYEETKPPENPEKPGKCKRHSSEAFTQVKRVAVRFSLELLCSYISLPSLLNGLVRSGNMNQDGSLRPFPAFSELESRRMQIAECYWILN